MHLVGWRERGALVISLDFISISEKNEDTFVCKYCCGLDLFRRWLVFYLLLKYFITTNMVFSKLHFSQLRFYIMLCEYTYSWPPSILRVASSWGNGFIWENKLFKWGVLQKYPHRYLWHFFKSIISTKLTVFYVLY